MFVDDAEKVSCASYEHDPKRGAPPPIRNMHAASISDQPTAKRSVTREQTEPSIKGNEELDSTNQLEKETLELITQNGYFRSKAGITCVLGGSCTTSISDITSGRYGAIINCSELSPKSAHPY